MKSLQAKPEAITDLPAELLSITREFLELYMTGELHSDSPVPRKKRALLASRATAAVAAARKEMEYR